MTTKIIEGRGFELKLVRVIERLGTLCAMQELVYDLMEEHKESPVLGVLIDWLDATTSFQSHLLGRAYRLELEIQYSGPGSLESMEKRAAEVSSVED